MYIYMYIRVRLVKLVKLGQVVGHLKAEAKIYMRHSLVN